MPTAGEADGKTELPSLRAQLDPELQQEWEGQVL